MRKNIVVKVTAFLFAVLTLITAALSVFAFVIMMAAGVYTNPLETVRENAFSEFVYRDAEGTASTFHFTSEENMEKYVSRRNYYFEIRDMKKNLLYSNLEGRAYDFSFTYVSYIEEWITDPNIEIDEGVVIPSYDYPIETEECPTTIGGLPEIIKGYEYEVTLYIPDEFFTTDKISFTDSCVRTLYELKNGVFFIGGTAILLFIISLVFLCCCAGWKNGEEKPRTSLFDKIPFDIFTFIYFTVFAVAVALLFEVYWEDFELIPVICLYIIGASVLIVSYLFSFAARAKTGELFKNTVIWFILKNIFRFLRFIWRGICQILTNLPIYFKSVFLLILLAVWSFILMVVEVYQIPVLAFFWLFGGTIIALYTLYITYGMNKLKKGTERIALGDIAHRINTDHMPLSLKKQAESVNSIGNGMYVALDERMRSERFKTELITNVSHDLKTPLTSIVNYVDLLKNEFLSEESDKEKIREYVSVLERQSERLRKLTYDLVEASKASTGNLETEPCPVSLSEMISQASGEYSEKLTQLGLELIVRLPDAPLTIMADGKHIWRVFDNLMNNITKYSLGGTRVYIDAWESDGAVYVIFRNTSKYELNVSPDELTERFVRGDASRHSEGSGLGLSIAKSLTELNCGRLDIYVDGDLFKVVLGFPTYKNLSKDKDD